MLGSHPKSLEVQTGNSTRGWRKRGWSTATSNMRGPRNRMSGAGEASARGLQRARPLPRSSQPSSPEPHTLCTHTLHWHSKAFLLICQDEGTTNTKFRRGTRSHEGKIKLDIHRGPAWNNGLRDIHGIRMLKLTHMLAWSFTAIRDLSISELMCVPCTTGVQFQTFTRGCPISPTPFSEETVPTVYSFVTPLSKVNWPYTHRLISEFSFSLSLFHFAQYFLKVTRKKKKPRASKDRHWDQGAQSLKPEEGKKEGVLAWNLPPPRVWLQRQDRALRASPLPSEIPFTTTTWVTAAAWQEAGRELCNPFKIFPQGRELKASWGFCLQPLEGSGVVGNPVSRGNNRKCGPQTKLGDPENKELSHQGKKIKWSY